MLFMADSGLNIVLILGFIVIAVLFRLLNGGIDRNRLEQYIEADGGRLIEASWKLFGPGWGGSENDRIYSL